MNPTTYPQLLRLLWPEIIVTITALAVVALDLLLRRLRVRVRFAVASCLASLGCAGAMLRLLLAPEQANLFDGVFVANPLTQLVQLSLLALSVLTLLLSIESDFTENVGEFVLLILTATVGMMFLVASQDLLVIFIALELLSLSLYILAGFDKRSQWSSEAALKYFLFGGMSAAFLLYGFSLLYGLANSTGLPSIAAAIRSHPPSPLLIIAMVTLVIGFAFKVAAAPLHFWAPDVYQGAPAPSAAFIASGSKVASVFIFFQVMAIGLASAEGSIAWPRLVSGWMPVLVVIAVLSMLVGNLTALAQTSLRRLLAYSAIAHAGYMLLAIVAHTQQSLAGLLYYVLTYALATLGTFGVIAVIEEQIGGDTISNLAGLSQRAPVLSACLFVFVLSLAGIPPLAGFFAKFYLFTSVLPAAPRSPVMLALVALAIAMSAVSLYYYLQVLKRIYVTKPPAEPRPIRSTGLSHLVICLIAAGVLLLGCFPHLLLAWIETAIRASGL